MGIFTVACMSLLLSQGGSDITYTNRRNPEFPLNFQESARAGIREVLVYASADKGRNWQRVAAVPASKDRFIFYAPSDGLHWLQVAIVNQQGVQMPDDKTLMGRGPDQIIVVDTANPIMKSFQAQRQGDEIFASWDVQEAFPDLSKEGIRLEYQGKDAAIATWTPIAIQPSLQGRTSFRPANNQAIVVRLTVRDLAGNQSYSVAEIAGTIAAAGFTPESGGAKPAPGPSFPTIPQDIVVPGAGNVIKPPDLPPPPKASGEGSPHKSMFPQPPAGIVQPPARTPAGEKVVADTRLPVEPVRPILPPSGGIQKPSGDGGFDVKPIAHATPARKALPSAQFVRAHQVVLQYKLNRVGPSGIGGVELWLTKDDGDTWERYAEDNDVSNAPIQGVQDRTFDLRDRETDIPFADGVYGFSLVVKNRAGMGKKPRPGDVPEIRVEIDTKTPEAQLFQPVPDPQHPDQLLIKWNATDKNLAAAPIQLEYAEKRDGPWLPIKHDLENTGRYTNQHVTGDYSWKVPPSTPVQVYLRLRVLDRAGNEGIAVTRDPQFVDLVEPEGVLIGVQPQPKRP